MKFSDIVKPTIITCTTEAELKRIMGYLYSNKVKPCGVDMNFILAPNIDYNPTTNPKEYQTITRESFLLQKESKKTLRREIIDSKQIQSY